jgi:hypothetical protein
VERFFARGERKRPHFETFNKQEVEKSGFLWGKMGLLYNKNEHQKP